jgi:cytochrome c556
MPRTHVPSLFLAGSAALLLAACSSEVTDADAVAEPAGDPPAEIELRHDNFEAIGDAFKAIRGQLESGTPDMAVIQASATDIHDRAGRLDGYFPEGSGRDAGWDTEALPTIWEQPEKFEEAKAKFLAESATMMEVAATGDAAAVGEQVKALGGSCKNCHDTFRLDDD